MQDCLQFLLPRVRDKEDIFLFLELTHHISVAQAKQERRVQTTADQEPGFLP